MSIKVLKIERKSGYLSLEVQNNLPLYADKVYLAAGAFQTSIIIANSLSAPNKTYEISENKLIITLWLTLSRVSKLNSIPKFCGAISKWKYYLQYYNFEASYLKKALNIAPPFSGLIAYIASFITFSFVYTCQEIGSKLRLSIRNNKIYATEFKSHYKFDISLIRNIVKSILPKSLFLFYRTKKFGFGYHIGSTFPMKKNPNNFETDILGRMSCFPGMHIVDGSILPTLPAIPLTYLIMANALRITKKSILE